MKAKFYLFICLLFLTNSAFAEGDIQQSLKNLVGKSYKYAGSLTSEKKEIEYFLAKSICAEQGTDCINNYEINIQDSKQGSQNELIVSGTTKYPTKGNGVFKAKVDEVLGDRVLKVLCVGEYMNDLVAMVNVEITTKINPKSVTIEEAMKMMQCPL